MAGVVLVLRAALRGRLDRLNRAIRYPDTAVVYRPSHAGKYPGPLGLQHCVAVDGDWDTGGRPHA